MNVPEEYCKWLASFFFVAGMDREDLAQEARLAAWLNPSHPRRAAYSRLVTLLVASKREKRGVLVELHGMHAAADDVAELAEARETLRLIVSTPLPDRQRYMVGRALRGESLTDEKWMDNALCAARQTLRAAA